jgi:hypothetical protein
VQLPIVAKQHNTDIILVDVEGNAEHFAGKFHQFVIAHARKPRHVSDAGGNAGDDAPLAQCQLRREGVTAQAQCGKCTLQYHCQLT